ncbi:hypothetical protein ACFUNF_24600 [Streptomyces sp. NPDC057291]|uniref:hypothetical protein n=1 Tax=Streptomyces sp. NPDC057291 TaxID=3346087 RepID=UPI00363AA1D5
MFSSRPKRLAAMACASLTLATGVVTTAATPAAAAPTFTIDDSGLLSNGSRRLVVYTDGYMSGDIDWNADPLGSTPGDALRARDLGADGWGVVAHASMPGENRTASTQGHSSPYSTNWITGDLVEGTWVQLQMCMVKGEDSYCSSWYSAHA